MHTNGYDTQTTTGIVDQVMKYQYSQVKFLQLEISSYCNVACPQCPRNHYGGPVVEDLPLVNWTLQDLQTALDVNFVRQLNQIYFCGTYGDPMFNKHIVEMCRWLKATNKNLKLAIHTNGSLSNPDAYVQLAPLVDFLAFGIDGLSDTNHLYRRNADWQTIMNHATTFIEHGGKAYWDYIVFEHNQHQVTQAENLSKVMKFAGFNIKKTSRFFNKSHKLVESVDVLDKNNRKIYQIKPTTDSKYINHYYEKIQLISQKSNTGATKISCHYFKKQEIYIGSDGNVFPCGWLHDRLYGIESQSGPDRQRLSALMDQAGGKHLANCFQTPLQQIIDGAWFNIIQESWKTQPLDRCVWICGDKVNLIKEQNEFVEYND